MPKVSVIIPTYNAEKYICETIDSVFAQTYKNFEVIIIDDGSKDNTRQILNKYNKRIKYIYQNNSGVSVARNRGIREAQGEYIAFLDADDIWLPDKLMKQVNIAEQNLEIGLIFSDGEAFNDNGWSRPYRINDIKKYNIGSLRHNISSVSKNDGSIFKGNFYEDLLISDLVLFSTVFVRKISFKKVGYFDENLKAGESEDYDLLMRIALNYPLLYFNSVTTRYRLRNDSSSGNLNLRDFSYSEYDAEVLKKQLHDCPKEYKNFLNSRIIESYKTAIWGYFNLTEFKKARSLCMSSLKYKKFQIKIFLYLVATFLPVGLIKNRTYLKK